VNPLRALLAALTPEIDEHDTRMRAVGASLKTLRSDVRSLHREVAAVAGRAEALSRQVAQLRRLRDGGRETAAMLDELAAVLATDRVAAHLRAVVDRAPSHDQPAPRLEIEALWPANVSQVLTEAVPDPVFFESAAPGARTLRVPPRLAPVSAIAIWTFVAEMIDGVVVPAAAARFGDLLTLPLDVTPGRLVRRDAGAPLPPFATKPWQTAHLVIDLTSNAASVTIGSGTGDVHEGGEHTYDVWFGSKPA
jgi:hypothetical protein